MRVLAGIGAAVFVLAVLAAGCGGGDDGEFLPLDLPDTDKVWPNIDYCVRHDDAGQATG